MSKLSLFIFFWVHFMDRFLEMRLPCQRANTWHTFAQFSFLGLYHFAFSEAMHESVCLLTNRLCCQTLGFLLGEKGYLRVVCICIWGGFWYQEAEQSFFLFSQNYKNSDRSPLYLNNHRNGVEVLRTDMTSGCVLLNRVYKLRLRSLILHVTSCEWILNVPMLGSGLQGDQGPPGSGKTGGTPWAAITVYFLRRLPIVSCQGPVLGTRVIFQMLSCYSSHRVMWWLTGVAARWLEHLGKSGTKGEAWQGSCPVRVWARTLDKTWLVVAVLWRAEHPSLYLPRSIFPVLHPSAKIPGSQFSQIMAP